jgi:MoaA/NifB/PqqE/SkfB family radical SAM enzyme
MITTSCDLACPGCDRFIDHNHNWTEDFELVRDRMLGWSKIIQPKNLTIIGGEPLIHPRIYDIIRHARNTFPNTTIEVFTNGLLLPKKPLFEETLQEIGNSQINLTLHNQNQRVRDKIFENIQEFIIKENPWNQVSQNKWNFQEVALELDDPTQGGWYDYRKLVNGKLKPWNDKNPTASYNACGVNIFPIAYDGRLYKCPPISMLHTHLEKFNRLDDPDWQPYLKYKGIGLDSSAEKIAEFVDNIFNPHEICGMCPANPFLKPQEEAVLKHSVEKL